MVGIGGVAGDLSAFQVCRVWSRNYTCTLRRVEQSTAHIFQKPRAVSENGECSRWLHDMKKRIALAVGAVTVVAVSLHLYFSSPSIRTQRVRACLDLIPNAEVTYVSDLSKQASQVISASLDIQGKGEIGFTGLSKKSFEEGHHLYLSEIGQVRFRTREIENGRESFGYAIDIGPDGPISELAMLEIASVQSAISHYDDILSCIAGWPSTTNEWPKRDQEILFKDDSGDQYHYAKKISQQHIRQVSSEAAPSASPAEPSM